ncbi:MAG: DUF2336 domain-containing protein [Bauldia sp.]|nr:DUF2336 domain-containing protein [Bauldia sp.]MCW5716970.1 DUF2336 domain-containing protein [Bauldia sp.]
MSHSAASDDLMALARVLPQDRDATLLRATTGLFCQEPPHDRDAMRRYEELALHFLPKVGVGDRAHVSALLAGRSDAPAAVIRALARDRIEVAAPVLRQSPALTTIDLLGVIATTGPEHHRLIAGRANISVDVLRALALARGQSPVEQALELAASAVENAPAPEELAAPAAPGEDDLDGFLRLQPRERLARLASVSERAASQLALSQPRKIDRVLRHAFACAEIVASARTGNRRRLVAAFAEILEIETIAVERLLDDPSGEPLVLMIKASGLKETDGRIVLLLANPVLSQSVETFFRLAELYAALEPAVAETFMAGWRKPDERKAPAPRHVPVFAENRAGRRELMPRPAETAVPARKAKAAG